MRVLALAALILGACATAAPAQTAQPAPAVPSLADILEHSPAGDWAPLDPNNTLYVWDHEGAAMGCLQLTFIPGMSYHGSWIAKVEGVRVDRSLRGLGIGEQMMDAMIAKSRARGCKQLQLTTDKRREAAQRFYARLGFDASHEGMKINLL